MKVNIELNGKTAELDIPDEKLVELGLVEKKKPTGYERVANHGEYTCVAMEGNVINSTEVDHPLDHDRYSAGNYYSNEEVANANARADMLMRRLRRFAAENGGIPSVEDWKDDKVEKWHLYAYYNINGTASVESGCVGHTRNPFDIYFNSREDCRKAIEEFKDELTWCFTEYQAMLY